MAKRIKSRDLYMMMLINGATKAGVQRDARKHASQMACRGEKITMIPATKVKIARTFDWTRPALHGDELFEIGVSDTGEIVAAAIIDDEGYAIPFNLISFNDEEMANIREMANDS